MAPPGEPSSWKALAELSSVGMTLVLSTVLGLAAGWYADRWLGTSPVFLLIGLCLGVAAGFVSLFRLVRKSDREIDDDGG